jgi:ferredoxin
MPAPSARRSGALSATTSWRVSANSRHEDAAGYQENVMALLIVDTCTNCDACKPVCPNEAITVGPSIYVIDPLRCTECVGAEDEPQCKLVCPADCIVPNPDFRESQEELLAKYKQIHG